MAAFLDACRFNPTLGGTTDWTYSSAVAGYNSPALAGVVNARVYKYRAEDSTNTQWEMGEGSYNTSTGVLTRTTVLFNSSGTGTASGQSGAGTKISFSTVPQVAIIALKEDLLAIEEANSFTATQQQQARVNIYAAPFDAIAYNGMQINGSVDISQELGTTGATLVSGNNKYIADNWEVGYTNSTASATAATQIAAASFPAALPGYNFALQIKATAAFTPANGDFAHFRQRVEGNRVARLGWGTASAQPIAIAFQFYSTVSGVSFVRAYNNASNRAYYIEFTVAAGWQWVTLTIPGDTTGTWVKDTGIGLYIDIFATGKQVSVATPGAWGTSTSNIQTTNSTNLLGTINNVVLITGFLLFPGLEFPNSTRAPLITRPADQEFTLTQRYYQSIAPGVTSAEFITGGMASAIQGYYPIRLNGVMRAIPTCSVSAASDWNNNPFVNLASIQPGTSAQFAGQSTFGFRLGITSASTGVPSPFGQLSVLDAVNTSAKIIADARL